MVWSVIFGKHILIITLSKSHLKGRGSSIVTTNRFDKNVFIADEGERVEDRESTPTKFIEIFPKTIVNEVPSPDIPINWSMNPYQGCEHGCVYCYARESHQYWGMSAGLDFESKILVKHKVLPAAAHEEAYLRTYDAVFEIIDLLNKH